MQENYHKPIIYYERRVKLFFLELIDTLLEKEYFSFRESAKAYVNAMKNYIDNRIHLVSQHPAPRYFDRYQAGLQYITYRPNRHTTWYIFFLQKENRFVVCYITNNHFEGQYIC
jgi:hypothetical protein